MAIIFPSRNDFLSKCLNNIEFPTDNDWSCTICQEDNATSNKTRFVALKSCGHEFHRTCIRSWFAKKKESCPLCRHTYYKQEMMLDVSGILSNEEAAVLIIVEGGRVVNLTTALASSHDLDEIRFRGIYRQAVEHYSKGSKKHDIVIDMSTSALGPIEMFLALAPTKVISLAEIQESKNPDMFEKLTSEILTALDESGAPPLDEIRRLTLDGDNSSEVTTIGHDWSCPICHKLQSPSPTMAELRELPVCGHAFHKFCFQERPKQSDGTHNLCPVCQTDVRVVPRILDFAIPMSSPDVDLMVLVDNSHLLNTETVMKSSMQLDRDRFDGYEYMELDFDLDCPPNCTDDHSVLCHVPTDWVKKGGAEFFFVFQKDRIIRLSEILASEDPNMFQGPDVIQRILRDTNVKQLMLAPANYNAPSNYRVENQTSTNHVENPTSTNRASRRAARRREARREARRRARQQ